MGNTSTFWELDFYIGWHDDKEFILAVTSKNVLKNNTKVDT